MPKSRLTYTYLGTCLATLFALANGCAAPGTDNPQGGGGSGGSTSTAGTTGSAGTSPGGTTGTAGNGTAGNGTAGSGTAGNGTAGSTGGSASGTAGNGTAGNGTARGGAGGTGGTGGSNPGTAGSTARGGSGGTSTAGTSGTAGTTGTAGTGGTGVRMDQNGIPLAKVGDSTNMSKKYLNLGDMRLINNRWGSDELGCTGSMQRVYINTDRTIGWEFNRPACGGAKAKPDYPEVEFGVAPFGATSNLLTTPAFSSTTLLPIQLTSLTSASVNVDTLFISFQPGKNTYYNINVELWLSNQNPLTSSNPGVHSEIIAFWGWEPTRLSSSGGWPCGATEQSKGTVTAGANTYNLCHQSDNWSSGWRFYNFNVNNGPLSAYTGKVDVKAMIDWVISKYAIPNNLWLTRIEVGSEIDDNTQGTVRIKNLTFEINGQNRSIELQP